MELNIPLHTILLTVAPSNSGKSFFCENVLIPQLGEKYPKLNIQYVSSDNIRRELLNSDRHKHDLEMLQVSEAAFKLLDLKLKLVTSFPISAEIVIVDTTGLSEGFRDEMIKLGKEIHYNVIPLVFDYNDREDYFSMKDDKTSNTVIAKHVQKLKKEVLRTINKTKYKDVFRIRQKDFSNISILVEDYDRYLSHFIEDETKEYTIVSDIHSCLDEFKGLILSNGSKINDDIISGDKVYIVQDYVDKGYAICETIDFIHKNYLAGMILPLLGNHENYVYKRLKNQIKDDYALETTYFNSVGLLLNNEGCKNKFFELVEASKHFYRHKLFYANHAPCQSKYLCKIDNISLKNQRNFVYARQKDFTNHEEYLDKVKSQLSFIESYTNFNSKPVVWGHVAIKNSHKFGNIVMIDTGCVSGGKLTSISFDKYTGKSYIKSVSSGNNPKINKADLLDIFKKESVKFNLSSLEPNDLKRINHLIKNKVNFISGTMCPADKNSATDELESLVQGLNYYKDSGIDKVILQKKYMGSNSTFYIFSDVEKCYSTSRNGYLIKKVDLAEVFNKFIKKHSQYMSDSNIECMVISGELMPWKTLAEGLIDETYLPVQIGLTTEYELLDKNGFYEEYSKLGDNESLDEFRVDFKSMKKVNLVEKYEQNTCRTLTNLLDYEVEHISKTEYNLAMNTYKEQLEIFGSDDVTHVNPFCILKEIYEDGTEHCFVNNKDSNIELFEQVSDDDYWIVNFKKDNWLEMANDFYEKVTLSQRLEGVVIKPEKVYNKGIAPFLKVRNPRYLALTYGYDYKKPYKYNKLFSKKSIKNKLKASIQEFELGKKMLEIPYNKINDANDELIQIYAQMILDEKFVETLDPRL